MSPRMSRHEHFRHPSFRTRESQRLWCDLWSFRTSRGRSRRPRQRDDGVPAQSTRRLRRPQQSPSPQERQAQAMGPSPGPGSWGARWVVGSLSVEVGRRRLLSRPCVQQPARSLADDSIQLLPHPVGPQQVIDDPRSHRFSGIRTAAIQAASRPTKRSPCSRWSGSIRLFQAGGLTDSGWRAWAKVCPTSRRRSERPPAPGRVVRRCSAPGCPRCSYDSAASAPPLSAFAPW